MSDRDTCRLPGCDEASRERSECDAGQSARYCSDQCQVSHEHVKADARDAMRAVEGRR